MIQNPGTFSSLFITDSPSEYNNGVIQDVLASLGSCQLVHECKDLDFAKGRYDLIVIDDAAAVENPAVIIAGIRAIDTEVVIVVAYTIQHWKVAKSVILSGADYVSKLNSREEILAKFESILKIGSDHSKHRSDREK